MREESNRIDVPINLKFSFGFIFMFFLLSCKGYRKPREAIPPGFYPPPIGEGQCAEVTLPKKAEQREHGER